MAGYDPRVSDLVGFGYSLKILISKRRSGGADEAALGPFS